MTAIGIDFGTTNSVVGAWTPGGVDVLDIDTPDGRWASHGFAKVMPSVFKKTDDDRALFGWDAKTQPQRFEAVKRLFATRQELMTDDHGTALRVEEVATMLFAQLRRATLAQGLDASSAVITVPANSRGLARHRTKICAGMAGFQVLTLLNEPTAAAMAYALRHPGDRQLLVFDWGGGTLDVTILQSSDGVFMEQASKGLPAKGGIDFDRRFAAAIKETVSGHETWNVVDRHDFDLAVELAKIELSTQDTAVVQLPGGETRRVTRTMLEHAIRPLIDEARRPIEQCLRDIKAGPGAIDAVVMVGGTSKVPAVRRFVRDLLDREPVTDIDPMTAVGEGAAVAAAILTGDLEDNDFFVSTEHALGTVTFSRERTEPKFSVLIDRNHKLPASRTDRFVPVHEDQDDVLIRVIEGDPEQPVDHPENVILAAFEVDLPDAATNPDRSFDITYRYDVDGILHVNVHDSRSGTLIHRHDVSFGVSEDKRELVRLAGRARDTVDSGTLTVDATVSTRLDTETTELLQRARVKVIPFVDENEAAQIVAIAERLETAGPDEIDDVRDELRAALAPYPFLF